MDSMTIEYTNRKGQIFYLHQGITKTGKPKYFFSLRREGEAVEKIPVGFEIYENPDARVSLRRKQPKIISDDEVRMVDQAMKRLCNLEYYQIDVKKDTITIYTGEENTGPLEALFGPTAKGKLKELLNRYVPYTAVLRFVLRDKEKREFTVERYCFRGSIDDWIEIGEVGKLKELVREYVKHLGEETFYELF